MAESTLQVFHSQLKSLLEMPTHKSFPHLILCHGDSDYLSKRCRRRLREHWLNNIKGESAELDCQNTSTEEIVDLMMQPQLFGGNSLYFCRHPESPHLVEALRAVRSTSEIQQILVIVINGKRAADALYKECKRLSAFELPCTTPAPFEVEGLAQLICREVGLNISREALSMLINTVGKNLSVIENEILKLHFLFHGQKTTPLSAQDIGPHVGVLREDFAFHLKQWIFEGREGQAQLLLHDLLRRGESPLAILGILAKHIRQSLRVLEGLEHKIPAASLAKNADLHPASLRRYTDYSQKMGKSRLVNTLRMCARADRTLKSAGMNDELTLAEIICMLRPGMA